MSIERSSQVFSFKNKGNSQVFFFFFWSCNDSELFLINKENGLLLLQCL